MPLKEKNEKETRSYVLPPLRVTKTEYGLIQRKAANSGMSLSEYVRRSCLDGYIVERMPLADITLIKELKRQGANFNQYQHRLNALSMDAPDEVKRVSKRIGKILDKLMDIESGSRN